MADILQEMSARSLRETANSLTKGKLDARLTKWRGAGLTYRAIARKTAEEIGIDVTEETVRVWCHDIEAEKKAS